MKQRHDNPPLRGVDEIGGLVVFDNFVTTVCQHPTVRGVDWICYRDEDRSHASDM